MEGYFFASEYDLMRMEVPVSSSSVFYWSANVVLR